MKGIVRAWEAWISIKVSGPARLTVAVDVVIDTGFSGYLTLPSTVIQSLSLPWEGERHALLADGSKVTFNVYRATVSMNRRTQSILVEQSESTPLIGMSLLKDCELNIQVRQRGKVSIKPLSPRRRSRR
jgi:clan AA aspartic protease